MGPFGIPGDSMEQVLSLQTLGGETFAAHDVNTTGCSLETYHTASCNTGGCVTTGCSTSICETNTCTYKPSTGIGIDDHAIDFDGRTGW